MLAFSSKPSLGETIYRSMSASKSKAFNLDKGSYQEAKVYAQSMGIARARLAVERAKNQLDPWKCIELLPELERDWGVIPGESDTLLDRQAAVAAKMLLSRGSRREALEEGLRTILGSAFVAIRTTPITEATSLMGSSQTFVRPEIGGKYVRLASPVGVIGTSCQVYYEPARTDGIDTLSPGDLLTVQPENSGLKEVVSVLTADEEKFTAVFTMAHDDGSYATTANHVDWASNRRTMLIVVTSTAALSTTIVRKVNAFMARVVQGVTTWHIVQPTTPGATTIGPMTLGSSPLGAVTIGAVDINPATALDFDIIPQHGLSEGGTALIVGNGVDLTNATAVSINGYVQPITHVSENIISVQIGPVDASGSGYIPIIDPMAEYESKYVSVSIPPNTYVKDDAYKIYPSPLTVKSYSPATASHTGGTVVTVTGTGFRYLTSLTFALGGPAISWTLVNDTTLTFIVPATTAGTKSLIFTGATYNTSPLVPSSYTFT